MKEKITILINEINKISDMIYQQRQADAIQQFALILDEITIITEQIFTMKAQGALPTFEEQSYLKILTEAMNALEVRDDVLLADILFYDLREQLEEINQQL